MEQEIIELLMNALKLCDSDTPSERQILYAFRKGLIYHRLAKIYDQSYKRSVVGAVDDTDVRRKKLLQLCRLYYDKSIKTLEQLDEPMEYLQVQCDRLTLQETLVESKNKNPKTI